MKNISESFLIKNIHDITALDIQAEINCITKCRSPKTVRNYHEVISAVMGIFCADLKISP